MSEIMRAAMGDAARYRWLLENVSWRVWRQLFELGPDVTHEQIDRAIDAEIEADAAEGKSDG